MTIWRLMINFGDKVLALYVLINKYLAKTQGYINVQKILG